MRFWTKSCHSGHDNIADIHFKRHHEPMFRQVAQPQGLISVLFDQTAPIDDRSEAAQDLGPYDEALPVLIEAAQNIAENERVAESIGEAIAEIWMRVGGFDQELIARMHPAAQTEIGLFFKL